MALISPLLIILGTILLYLNVGGAMAATALAIKTRSSITIQGCFIAILVPIVSYIGSNPSCCMGNFV